MHMIEYLRVLITPFLSLDNSQLASQYSKLRFSDNFTTEKRLGKQ